MFVSGGVSAGYQTMKNDCSGLPKLPLSSIEGTCVGLIAGPETGFIKPRKALQVPGENKLFVTDMGGWSDNRGVLWLLEFTSSDGFSGEFRATKLATGLSLPHEIKLGSDGAFYLGEADRITRFFLIKNELTDPEVVVSDLPYIPDDYQHPLTSFTFLANGDLLVNVGSKTDACGNSGGKCEEVEHVGLRLYPFRQKTNSWDPNYRMYATGLRNSMALVVHPSGTILQAENSSDIPSAEEPYEEINVVREGGFYGWPYCLNRAFDQKKIPNGCEIPNYVEPLSLMPPHVAPLDMIYYEGDVLPMLQGKLLISWHGYRVVGNRLVSYRVNSEGLPLLSDSPVQYFKDPIPPSETFSTHLFSPEGGTQSDAQHEEVIGRWNDVPGLRPEGAPVGLLQLEDGTLLIVDDKNKALLRLAPGEEYRDSAQKSRAEIAQSYKFGRAVLDVMRNRCGDCHNELKVEHARVLNADQWLSVENGMTILEHRLTDHPRRMPPGQPLDSEDLNLILNSLKDD